MTDAEIFKIMDGMEEANREMVAAMEASAPRCHMRPMGLEYSDWLESSYWECSVCGHTKPT